MKRIGWLAAALLALNLALAACGGAPTSAPTPLPSALPTTRAVPYTQMPAQELSGMLASKDFTLVNVHVPYDGEIPNTDLFIPYDQIGTDLDRLPDKNARIVVYCRSGPMSTAAAKTLVAAGYTNILELAGGISAWEAAGYELIRK